MHDNQHSSYNAGATAITPATVSGLTEAWHFQAPNIPGDPPSRIYTSPTVYGGAVYVGSNTGMFYKLNETTGAVMWSVDLGHMPKATCRAKAMLGTAAVALDPTTNVLTVYAAGGDGNVDALRASDGAVLWKSPVDTNTPGTSAYFDFSSPMVADGHVYEGISSSCDSPLVRGGLAELDQATGARLATYYTVPAGSVGGSIWSTPAITKNGSTIFITTGNGDPTAGALQGDSVSIVALDANTLARKDIWTIPSADHGPDSDFGGSPTLFTASLNGTPTAMVGAENKNGYYYAWNQSNLAAGPVWKQRYGAHQEVAAAVWNGSHLFVVNGITKIGGVKYAGGVRELNPADGTPVWETGVTVPDLGFGSPTMDGGGVLAAPTYNTVTPSNNAYILVDASTGAVLRQFPLSGPSFPQATFADNHLFITDGAQGAATLYAYK
ncbi:MAG: outer membrane protein assembly factor BamB family protein [Gaiellales bacterium]